MFKKLLILLGLSTTFSKRIERTLATFNSAKENLLSINQELADSVKANAAKIEALQAQNALHSTLAAQNANVIVNINTLLGK